MSYVGLVNQVLAPMGFARLKDVWVRRRGDLEQRVALQRSSIDQSVTADLWWTPLETRRILASIPCETKLFIYQEGKRVAALVDGTDRWWRNDPNGPEDLAELIRRFGVPYLDQFDQLGNQAFAFGRGFGAGWPRNINALAVTLYRMGEIDEAIALYSQPEPTSRYRKSVTPLGRCVETWLRERTAG